MKVESRGDLRVHVILVMSSGSAELQTFIFRLGGPILKRVQPTLDFLSNSWLAAYKSRVSP